jgi:hypothetical protein
MNAYAQTGAVVAEASNDADAVLVHTFDLDFVRHMWLLFIVAFHIFDGFIVIFC